VNKSLQCNGAELVVRIPRDLKGCVERQGALDAGVLVPALGGMKAESEQRAVQAID
jgi:hypothetical protein